MIVFIRPKMKNRECVVVLTLHTYLIFNLGANCIFLLYLCRIYCVIIEFLTIKSFLFVFVLQILVLVCYQDTFLTRFLKQLCDDKQQEKYIICTTWGLCRLYTRNLCRGIFTILPAVGGKQ